jgi:hypothetical protein
MLLRVKVLADSPFLHSLLIEEGKAVRGQHLRYRTRKSSRKIMSPDRYAVDILEHDGRYKTGA